jgi:hypothetical protein
MNEVGNARLEPLRILLNAVQVEFADLRPSREGIAEELHAAVLELESDWLREAKAALRQFLWERTGADSFAKRRSV